MQSPSPREGEGRIGKGDERDIDAITSCTLYFHACPGNVPLLSFPSRSHSLLSPQPEMPAQPLHSASLPAVCPSAAPVDRDACAVPYHGWRRCMEERRRAMAACPALSPTALLCKMFWRRFLCKSDENEVSCLLDLFTSEERCFSCLQRRMRPPAKL